MKGFQTAVTLKASPDLIVSDDVNSPGTETGCSSRFGPNEVGVELWLSQILFFHHGQTGLRDVLLVVRDQRLQEVIHLT